MPRLYINFANRGVRVTYNIFDTLYIPQWEYRYEDSISPLHIYILYSALQSPHFTNFYFTPPISIQPLGTTDLFLREIPPLIFIW